LNVADVLGVNVNELESKNLKFSFPTYISHFTVAGTYPSFLNIIGKV